MGSPKECRDLPHFKSEIGDEKNFFKQKPFLALKSEIVNAKKTPPFLHNETFFQKFLNLLKETFFFENQS